MESWKKVWRNGISPLLSVEGLRALRAALLEDDQRLISGSTCWPYPMPQFVSCEVEAADAIGFCAWQGDGLNTVGEIEEHFAAVCRQCDRQLGWGGSAAEFVRWWDTTPRETARGLLILEVDRAIGANLETAAA